MVTSPYFNFALEAQKEMQWIEKGQNIMMKTSLDENDHISFAGYFSEKEQTHVAESAITCMLPLYEDKAASAPMVTQGLKVIMQATEKLNEGQIPVITADQPIFAIIKNIQWQNEHYGEEKIIPLLGGLCLVPSWKTT